MPHPPHHVPSGRLLGAGGIALLSAVVLGSTIVGVTWLGGPEEADRERGAADVCDGNAMATTRGIDQARNRTGNQAGAPDRAPTDLAMGRAIQVGASDGSAGRPGGASNRMGPAAATESSSRVPGDPAQGNEGDSLATLLPPSMIELARNTVWDEHATETLDRLMLIAFDANGDFSLDDFERITAVHAMREAMWPSATEQTQAFVRDGTARDRGAASPDATLGPEDLRLHHDVDESRRLDHAAQRERGDERTPSEREAANAELRAVVTQEFRLVDDGRLTAEEYSRFLRRYRAGSARADLNRDGRADEADLRLFLDIARPILDE